MQIESAQQQAALASYGSVPLFHMVGRTPEAPDLAVLDGPAPEPVTVTREDLDRFYAAAPVCSPTRASVMTGRSPIRTKVTNHGRYMRPHERTIAETLKAAGYVTGIFGKVHLGLNSWPGKWITLKGGVVREMDLIITDNPAPNRVSNCAFVLAVEEKDVEYPKNRLGKKILPIFKTAKLSHDELDIVYESTTEGQFDCVNGPVFNDY